MHFKWVKHWLATFYYDKKYRFDDLMDFYQAQ